MKKIILCLLCASIMVSCYAFSAQAKKKITKPARVYGLNVVRKNKSTLKISWGKASGAKGYKLYMKESGKKYKVIKTSKKRSFTKSGLTLGKSYYFKVRAYKKYKGKTYYGKYSPTIKYKLKSWEYLVNVMSPFTTYGNWGYTEYKGAETLKMSGNNYYNSFSLQTNGGDTGYAIFNFNGKYSKIIFTLGEYLEDSYDEGGDKNLLIECDDETVKNILVKKQSLPKTYTINVYDVYKFKLSYYKEKYYYGSLGFGNVKLYY